MPGWNDGAKYLRDEELSWHCFWKINGRHREGHITEIHRISREKYHRYIKHIHRKKKVIQPERMAHPLCQIVLEI